MKSDTDEPYDPLVFGGHADEGLVAIEFVAESKDGPDEMALFFRRDGATVQASEPFEPFIVGAGEFLRLLSDGDDSVSLSGLTGPAPLDTCAVFASWKDCLKARDRLARETGTSSSAPGAPYAFVNDPVQQHLMRSGRTLFLGMDFEDLRRMQVDIECRTTEGYDFCHAAREGDRIIAIAMSDQTGWTEVLSGHELAEKEMLARFVAIVRERDPDVIEGHNIFNFDLPYLAERAKRHGVKLGLGRNGAVPRRRASRFSVGERTLAYERFDVFGRHIVDTLFLVHAYDVSHRSLAGFGLKEVAIHFGLSAEGRTTIDGSRISRTFDENPEQVMRYACDDVVETGKLSDLLARSSFLQTRMLPYTYQNVCVRGNATKIDALLLREYLRQGYALPMPGRVRPFAGGYTDLFVEGVIRNVHHCDVRSLYPSLMLTRKLAPRSDVLGAFLRLLSVLRELRLKARADMDQASTKGERIYFDAMQSTFKVLINSFYGYLGFSQARFNDFDAAEQVTGAGRALLHEMVDWLREHGATPVEIDTDGIYFVPPVDEAGDPGAEAAFREAFVASLPAGIDVEFDAEFVAMYSYKMKNYALLSDDGEMVLKGAALKSRGLEPFQRDFLREIVRMKLEGREQEIAAVRQAYDECIRSRAWPIEKLAKTERLQDAPATYAAKRGKGKRARSAAYELALRSPRDYRAGDQLSFYVTGEKKSVSVHEHARLVSEWDPTQRDENVAYYLAKLDALYKKFG